MADSCKCDATGPAKINGFHDVPKPFFIGVGGGTASGKSTVCSRITERLGQNEVDQSHKQVVIISIESFYKELSDEELEKAKKGQFNFDHPGAFDEASLLQTLQDIKAGKTVHVPVYDLKTFKRKDEIQIVPTVDVIILEGILVFYFKEIRDMFDMKLFVDTDPDTRLSRRVMRDMKEMGRELEQILYQYTTYVKPAFEDFCLPTKKYVDVIIPRGADNTAHLSPWLPPALEGAKSEQFGCHTIHPETHFTRRLCQERYTWQTVEPCSKRGVFL